MKSSSQKRSTNRERSASVGNRTSSLGVSTAEPTATHDAPPDDRLLDVAVEVEIRTPRGPKPRVAGRVEQGKGADTIVDRRGCLQWRLVYDH